MSTVAFAMYVVSDTNHLPGIILYVFSIEGLIFLFLGLKNKFRVGISSKAVIVSDREVTIAYLTGLRQVTIEMNPFILIILMIYNSHSQQIVLMSNI